jgi:hypothetical protein
VLGVCAVVFVSGQQSAYEPEIIPGRFNLTMYMVNPRTRQRLPGFSATLRVDNLIEFLGGSTYLSETQNFIVCMILLFWAAGAIDDMLASYNFSTITPVARAYERTEMSTKIEVQEQTASFPNGVNFTLRIEKFNSSFDRIYFGWKQHLAPRNVKITYILDGVDLPSRDIRPTRSFQVGLLFSLSVQVQVDQSIVLTSSILDNADGTACDHDNATSVPLVYCGNVRYTEPFNASVETPNEDVRFLQLDIFDKRGKFRSIQQLDGTCINSTGRNYYRLRTARFQDPTVDGAPVVCQYFAADLGTVQGAVS